MTLYESYSIDLDGVNGDTVRTRHTTVLAYDDEEIVTETRFAVPVSRHPIDSINLADPRAIPAKSLGYAMYDVVHIVNQLMDALRISESAVERLLARFMAVPAARFLRLRRSATFLVSDHAE
ncbi:MAG: hypothetical protein RDU83_01030 [bacterium]|nr:hypothetical protein [bacterium]